MGVVVWDRGKVRGVVASEGKDTFPVFLQRVSPLVFVGLRPDKSSEVFALECEEPQSSLPLY